METVRQTDTAWTMHTQAFSPSHFFSQFHSCISNHYFAAQNYFPHILSVTGITDRTPVKSTYRKFSSEAIMSSRRRWSCDHLSVCPIRVTDNSMYVIVFNSTSCSNITLYYVNFGPSNHSWLNKHKNKLSIMTVYTVSQKTCYFVFDYNSRVSLSIFTLLYQ